MKERQSQVEKKISHIFNKKIGRISTKIDAYNIISNRYNHFKNMVCEIDIDILERIKQLKKLNTKINKLELNEKKFTNLDIFSSILNIDDSSLKQSLFSFDPCAKIKKNLEKFEFIPFSQSHLDILKALFKNSTTVSSDLITSDILLVLPRIKSGCLLYRVSKDISSPSNFHKFCDNKGPSLIIIKTIDGYVFGGFNPISWISEYMYNETENAFLFSLSDGKYRKPLRCPVYKTMKKFAIKQNENDFSPGFGETDNADLFIAFKNLKNSYSRLDNVYKCPRGYKPDEFLAGKPNEWKIEDVEVYAIEISNEIGED